MGNSLVLRGWETRTVGMHERFQRHLSPSGEGRGARKDQQKIDAFNSLIEDIGLGDLGFKGQMFTWSNNRRGGERIRERLDRVLVNQQWSTLFPSANCTHELFIGSDHAPICLHLTHKERRGGKQFRFEDMWLEKDKCHDIIRQAWQGAARDEV